MSKQNSRIGRTHIGEEFIKKIPDNVLLVEAAQRRGGQTLSTLIKPTSQSVSRIDLAKYKNAVNSARNVDSPNRNPLYDVYTNIDIDNTLTSIMDTRIDMIKQAKFVVNGKDGKPDEEARKLFEREWFAMFLGLSMKAKFWGPTLIEMFDFTDTGEIATVDEVNRYHVKPEKGIVTVDQTDEKGYDYLNGQQAIYYLQVGNNKDLGLLYKAAVHVLAKKYALSTWAEFNEKLGIPFRTVTSSIHDKERQKQLGVIMDQMGSAGWAVLSEGEKVDLLAINGTNPTQCFSELIAKLDAEITLLILRQSSTASSDKNKGTYGSLEMLQKVTDLAHNADLADMKYLINGQLIPRMVQYGYKLDGYTFDWDKSVKMSVKDIVDYVVNLSTVYHIDPEFVTQQTGIPIIGVKTEGLTAPTGAVKKKSLNKIAAFYKSCCGDPVAAAGPNTSAFEKLVLSVSKKIWTAKKAEIVNIPLLKETAKQLRTAMVIGYGSAPDDENISDADKVMLQKMENNVYVFSGFKTHTTLKAIAQQLVDDKGNYRAWEDFKTEALKLNTNYNLTYLRTEYDTAITSSTMANQWQDIQATKAALPLLQFDATLDRRTTQTCRALDGIILPADDSFWDTYYLPLHWNERSVIRQLSSGKVTDKSTINAPELQAMFENNVGKTGIIFPESHPYFETSAANAKKIKKASRDAMND